MEEDGDPTPHLLSIHSPVKRRPPVLAGSFDVCPVAEQRQELRGAPLGREGERGAAAELIDDVRVGARIQERRDGRGAPVGEREEERGGAGAVLGGQGGRLPADQELDDLCVPGGARDVDREPSGGVGDLGSDPPGRSGASRQQHARGKQPRGEPSSPSC